MACCFTKELRILQLIQRQRSKQKRQLWFPHFRSCSVHSSSLNKKSTSGNERLPTTADPLPVYMETNVQKILTNITGLDPNKAARVTQIEAPKKPVYHVVSEKELSQFQEDALRQMYHTVIKQRPPFMKEREQIQEVISRDPEIAPVLDNKLVMIDTSRYTNRNKDKLITVREADGTLRHATQEERDRMLQLFFPKEGRAIFSPSLFQPKHLKSALDNGKYEYVLERACCQYEPDNPEYIRVTSTVYEHLSETGNFEHLRSTRHFAPMAFYFAWNNKIDTLLIDMIKNELLLDAADLVKLHHIIHKKEYKEEVKPLDLVKEFLEKHARSQHKPLLELHIQSYEDKNKTQDLSENVKRRKLLELC